MKLQLAFLCMVFVSFSLLAQTDTPSESSTDRPNIQGSLAKVNKRLKTLDNGYYKRIEFDGNYILNTVPAGTRKIAIKDIEDVILAEDLVQIICKTGDCVKWDDGDSNDALGFDYTDDDDPYALRDELRSLIRAIRNNKGSNPADRAIQKINEYFVTFDDGFYGTLSYDESFIYNDMSKSGRRRIPINAIRDVKIVGNAVRFRCKNGNDCARGSDQETLYDAMGFSSDLDYNADYFAGLLRDLLNALR